jgi:methyl-accepting chemotaxis protein
MALPKILSLNSISKKFLIPTLFFMVILLGGLGTIMIKQNHATIRSLMESKANALANVFSQISASYVMNFDLMALEVFVKEALKDPDVVFIVFYDATRKPLTESSKPPSDMTSLSIYDREIRSLRGDGKPVGYLQIGYSQQTLSKNLRSGIQTVVLSNLVAFILLILGVTILFRGITQPLGHLVGVIEKVAQGDLTNDLAPNLADRHDEMGILASAFSRMSANLKRVIKKIQGASYQTTVIAEQVFANAKKVSDGANHQAEAAARTSSSVAEMDASIKNIADNINNLSSSAENTSSSLEEMSAAIAQVADSTVALSTSVKETSTSLVQMSGAIKQVVGHTDTLASYSEEATSSIMEMNVSIEEVEKNAKESALLTERVNQEAAELGAIAIEQTIDGMEQIKKAVEKSAYVINKLDERTEKIGKILTVINEVTRQTNLLALNASIQAAQAGNQGRGFAVVADEMRNLANRTAGSTTEIIQLIRDVQSETKDAVISVKEGLQSVEEGVRRSIQARGPLNKILESSKRSSGMSRHIENATLEQVKATSQLNQVMQKVNDKVMQIHTAMKELEVGTLKITQSSEKMSTITHQVQVATEEQAKGSKQINDAGENVIWQIQQIANAISEQRVGNEVIQKSIFEIQQITELSVQLAQEMNQAMEGLTGQANVLKGEVNHFKI